MIKKKMIIQKCLLVLITLLVLCMACGCTSGKKKEERTSLGVDDGVGGFLFNFDTRKEVQDLVKYKKGGKLPVRVTWFYDEDGGTIREEGDEVGSNAVDSEDEAVIRDIYYGLGNTIVVGLSTEQSNTFIHYFVEFELPGGEKCRFNFVSVNTIRIGDQNYVVETDGSLWKSLVIDDRDEEKDPG